MLLGQCCMLSESVANGADVVVAQSRSFLAASQASGSSGRLKSIWIGVWFLQMAASRCAQCV